MGHQASARVKYLAERTAKPHAQPRRTHQRQLCALIALLANMKLSEG